MDRLKLGLLALLAGLCLDAVAASPLSAAPCSPSSTTLCLSAGRFSAEVRWTDFQGNTGTGHAVSLTSDTGYFWFFSDTNVELVVKVLDGRALDGHFWVFYGALSNVEYEMTVRDTQTGDARVYENPSGRFASTGDTLAFPPDSGFAAAGVSRARPAARIPFDESVIQPAAVESAAACTASPTSLCLGGGRFRLTASWTDFAGNTGAGQAVGLTSDTGYFWFFSSSNVELVVKALDGRVLNDHFWIFYGALSNVEYTLTVTDTVTGIVRTYQNPPGLFASVGDVSAFGKPTTIQLIEGAVAKGEINDETALLYKVYAFFGDGRLPEAYRGDPSQPTQVDHGILFDVANRWATLSAATQSLLEPFLTPPIYPESWLAAGTSPSRKAPTETRAEWTRIETARAAVWYRPADAGGATAAGYVAAEIERVWTKEVGLMQREPLSDGGLGHNGGDAKFDVYLLPSISVPNAPQNPDGLTCTYPGQGRETPGAVYLLIRISSASTVEAARSVVAHEFFHAIAAMYKNGFNGWLNEATATWMEDYVYPTEIQNMEQLFASRFLTEGYQLSFDHPIDFGYPDYLFFFYLARSTGSGEVNHQIWNNVESMSSVRAVDAAISGGFKERWPEFALYCWNQPSVDKFNTWDRLGSGLVAENADPWVPLTSGDGKPQLLDPRSVPHLAMAYAYVDVVDDTIKRVEIQTQPVAYSTGNAKTQAWIKLADGSTRVEDWTDKSRVVFCRDKPSERVTKLLLLYTNSGLGNSLVWGPGSVTPYASACGGLKGTARVTSSLVADGATVNETIDVTAEFQPLSVAGSGGAHYYLARLTMRYSYVETAGCTWTIGPVERSATFGVGGDGSEIVIDNSTNPPGYTAMANFGFPADGTQSCPGGIVNTTPGAAGGTWLSVPEGRFYVNQDGSLSGSYTDSHPDPRGTAMRTWTWDFRPD